MVKPAQNTKQIASPPYSGTNTSTHSVLDGRLTESADSRRAQNQDVVQTLNKKRRRENSGQLRRQAEPHTSHSHKKQAPNTNEIHGENNELNFFYNTSTSIPEWDEKSAFTEFCENFYASETFFDCSDLLTLGSNEESKIVDNGKIHATSVSNDTSSTPETIIQPCTDSHTKTLQNVLAVATESKQVLTKHGFSSDFIDKIKDLPTLNAVITFVDVAAKIKQRSPIKHYITLLENIFREPIHIHSPATKPDTLKAGYVFNTIQSLTATCYTFSLEEITEFAKNYGYEGICTLASMHEDYYLQNISKEILVETFTAIHQCNPTSALTNKSQSL